MVAAAPPVVGDVENWLAERYPPATAESWDRVGLVTGEPDRPVTGILLTVDVTDAVIGQAAELGAELIIAHHPLLLRGVNAVDPRHPKGRMITALIRQRIAVITAHTNADVPTGGVADSLADALGLLDARPLRPAAAAPAGDRFDKVISYLPADHADAVIDAMAEAGAGVIGEYRRCAFRADGTGTFEPQPGARPMIGTVGEREQVAEVRIEMIADRRRRDAVLAALLAAHPYQRPAYQVIELAAPPAPVQPTAAAGLGRVGRIEPQVTLREFARRVAATLPPTGGGIRVAGDPDRPIGTVALQGGAGDDLLDAARDVGADVYLTSDLRHHPASEAIAWDRAPALIDVPHWAAEWTWLPRLRERLTVAFPASTVTVSELNTDPWTFSVS